MVQRQDLAAGDAADDVGDVAEVLAEFAPAFRGDGLVPLQGGVGGGGRDVGEPAKLEPGSVLGVPLITGDVEMTPIGTCTEVIGDRVWGFGHSFNNEGPGRAAHGQRAGAAP